jgi:hypothetical protein
MNRALLLGRGESAGEGKDGDGLWQGEHVVGVHHSLPLELLMSLLCEIQKLVCLIDVVLCFVQ